MTAGGRRWWCAAALLIACKGSGGSALDTEPLAPHLLSCEALLPPETREAILPGCTVTTERLCPTCGPLCILRSQTAADIQVSVAYDCQARYSTEDLSPLLESTLRRGGFEVPALGRAAAQHAPAPGMQQIVAWDSDTPCALIVTWLGGESERVVEATRGALSAASQSNVLAPSRP